MSSLALAIALAAQLAKAPLFTVGTATAAPGQKVFGALEVPAGVDAGTRIDVAVVRGTKPGPVLALVSGAPAALSGTVILVPLVNVASFEAELPGMVAL